MIAIELGEQSGKPFLAFLERKRPQVVPAKSQKIKAPYGYAEGSTANERVEIRFARFIERYDFAEYFCEDHPVSERVRHFAESEATIGPNGSGFINTLFMPAGALAVELFSPARHEDPWSLVPAKILKQRYYEIMPYFQGNQGYAYGNDIFANIALIEQTLEQEFSRSGRRAS